MQHADQLAGIARLAGDYMRQSIETESTDKTNAKDFVTVADIKAQNILMDRLKQLYPDRVVLSEESPEEERQAMYAHGFTGYILDPIDGTYNFKRDMRESSISIGYIENGQAVAGAIYDPYKDEMFTVEAGKGAYKNGRPIHVSSQKSLDGSSITTSNSYDDEAMARNLRRHLGIYEQTGVMPWTNCPGSGVLIMAYVACGRFDAYHHNGVKPWDAAAAYLLVREAGGVVQQLASGEDAGFTESSVLLGSPAVVSALRQAFDGLGDDLLS